MTNWMINRSVSGLELNFGYGPVLQGVSLAQPARRKIQSDQIFKRKG